MENDARRRVAATWDAGDYAQLAALLAGASDAIVAKAGAGAGAPAIDVAAGTGSLALRLAAAGWSTSAVDVAPSLVAQGREAARRRSLEVEWFEGTLDELPVDDRSQSLVASSFGLIFAPDPQVALAEARRVLAGDGRLLISTWPHDGYMARMTEVMSRFMPPGAPTFMPFRWGDPTLLSDWLAEHFTDVHTTIHPLPWRFADVPTAVDFLFDHSPGHVAASAFTGVRTPAMKDAVAEHLATVNGSTGPVEMTIDYQITMATPT